MELVDGPNLGQELQAHAPDGIPLPRSFELAIAITEAIAAAHEAASSTATSGPRNILLPASGAPPVKVGDFGISRYDEQPLPTKSGSLKGTPIYPPPETSTGEKLGKPADIYSLGVVSYRLCGRGHLPYELPATAGLAAVQHAGAPPWSVWCEQDAFNGPSLDSPRLARELPQAREVRLTGCGHYVQYGRPEAVVAAVEGLTRPPAVPGSP